MTVPTTCWSATGSGQTSCKSGSSPSTLGTHRSSRARGRLPGCEKLIAALSVPDRQGRVVRAIPATDYRRATEPAGNGRPGRELRHELGAGAERAERRHDDYETGADLSADAVGERTGRVDRVDRKSTR